MCGIAGILLASRRVELDGLKKMTDTIKHRGPDGEGHWINDKKNIGFGHRRLSIIDLTEKGSQPMHYLNGRYTITYNGEIYNYLEIKNELIKKGYQFYSDSDTEVLLALYHQERENCLSKLDGMFAFAIWDETEQTLFCARDRFGEKPFYYIHEAGNSFMFASEMKALWANGITKNLLPHKVSSFLESGELLDGSDLSETFYKNIYQLDGSHYILIQNLSKLEQKRYYTLNIIDGQKGLTVADAESKLFDLLEKSVRFRLRADVKIGSSLSGGLDSSTIVKLIESLKPPSYIQTTFSARFKNYSKDEGVYIEEIVRNTKNITPYEVWPDIEELDSEVEGILYHQEEPFGSSSIYAQWKVMELAKKENVKILLDGQGADEYLGGYIPYYDDYLNQLYFNSRGKYKKTLDDFNRLRKSEAPIPQRSSTFRQELSYAKQKILRKKRIYPTDHLKQTLLKDTFSSRLKILLRYADRNSMAHSIEVRLPFLYHELVEFIFSLPDEYILREGHTKWILRKAMDNILPPKINWRIDKIGFEVPQDEWLKRITNEKVKKRVNNYLKDHNSMKPVDESNISNWNYYIIDKFL